MNNDQRKFLIETVQRTHRTQEEQIKAEMPKKPSLNNYLVASFLDNSIKFNDIEKLKEKMRDHVLRMGKEDALIKEDYDRYKDSYKSSVAVNPEDLFVIPENYLTALNEYEEKKRSIDEKLKVLNSQKETIVMKIQIGSNAVLDKLVGQIDNMGDLNILNTQLLLN